MKQNNLILKFIKNILHNFLLTGIAVILCLFCVSAPILAQDDSASNPADKDNASYVSGKVISILAQKDNSVLEDSFHTKQLVQMVKILVLSGKYRGQTVYTDNQLTSNPIYDINIRPGNRVILSVEETPHGTDFYISDLERVPVLLILFGAFLALLMIAGGKQGLRSIISILVTALLIFFVLVPAVLNKFPVIPTTVAIAFISTFLTIFTVSGINLKSLSAALGTVISVMISGIVSSLVIYFAPLNGFSDQEAAMLWSSRPDLDFTGLLTAGVIIASLGAAMDVGMSIASSVYELKKVNNSLSPKELFVSGLNVGRDIMGTMANTLILAYIGGGFSLVLLVSNAPLIKLLNLNSIAAEIASALTGSIGIIFCVPITSLIAGYLIGRQKKENLFQELDKNKVEAFIEAGQ